MSEASLRHALEWALDVIDLYDERLAKQDGHDTVYTPLWVEAKAKARRELAPGPVVYTPEEAAVVHDFLQKQQLLATGIATYNQQIHLATNHGNGLLVPGPGAMDLPIAVMLLGMIEGLARLIASGAKAQEGAINLRELEDRIRKHFGV